MNAKDNQNPLPAFDIKTLMETQQRNFQAMTQAGQMAMTGWQAMVQRQAEMISNMTQTNTDALQQIMKEGTPEEKMARQADICKRAYETSVIQSREMTQMMTEATREAAALIQKRVKGTVTEVSDAIKKAADKAA